MRKERMPIVQGDIVVRNLLNLIDGNVISLGPDRLLELSSYPRSFSASVILFMIYNIEIMDRTIPLPARI